MSTPGSLLQNTFTYFLTFSAWISLNRFPTGRPFVPTKNVQAVTKTGRRSGPGFLKKVLYLVHLRLKWTKENTLMSMAENHGDHGFV